MRRRSREVQKKWSVFAALAATLMAGCLHDRPEVTYLGERQHDYYRGHATEIAFPAIDQPLPEQVSGTHPPQTVRDEDKQPIRDLTLAEAVHTALMNSEVILTAGTFLNPASGLYTNPNFVPSVYDPAIQESGVLFGNRGAEAALADFDAQLNTSLIFGRNEQVQNNIFFGGGLDPGAVLMRETGDFQAALSKSFAHGGSISVLHNVNYLNTNAPAQLFPSSYAGNVQVQYQLPLLAGAGTEYTHIAGPIGQAFGGLTGVSQGVLIARINGDITLADFQASVRNMVKDVEDAYWDLYLAYRNYHTTVTAKESALLTWRIADLQLQGGVRTRAEVAQARDQYFATEAASNNERSAIYSAEVRLRRLMGIATNDGERLRPIDEPVTAELVPDWFVSLTEAMTQRVELRRQKWNIKSLELQLRAAESLTRPRMDFVGGYQINGFGDRLLGYGGDRIEYFYQDLREADQMGWNFGLQANWPIGFRSAKAQVRNIEFRLAKAQKVLMQQEQEISHELAFAFQEVARTYRAARLNMNRLIAARENVVFLEPNIREGEMLLDELLRAQLRQAEAEVAYYQSVTDYNKSLVELQFRKGTLLQHNGVLLAEGGWHPEAYDDAAHHGKARSFARPAPWLSDEPEAFASPAPVGGVYFTSPAALPEPQPTPWNVEENPLQESAAANGDE